MTRRWDFSAAGVERSLRESLDRLGLDAVDILFAHDPDQAWDGAAREGLASLARLKAAGVVSAIGIGTNSTAGLAPLIRDGLVDVIMLANRYSLLDHGALEPVLEPAREAGVAVIAVGVFATGLLATARPAPGATYEYRPADAAVIERARRIASICEDHGVELPAAALAFPLMHPAVAAVAVGMRSPRRGRRGRPAVHHRHPGRALARPGRRGPHPGRRGGIRIRASDLATGSPRGRPGGGAARN